MHALAIDLHDLGDEVSGSDDKIFEPARSSLKEKGLLPQCEGWFPEKIHEKLDKVVLGMHAKEDNPELQKALDLNLPVVSFPQFIGEKIRDKQKIVIAGSHGKTTITSMIMHVLLKAGFKFDYLVGGKVPGFEKNVSFKQDSKLAVLEGDEYISSALDSRPKFLWYAPDIAVLSGLAWDHINVFKTQQEYYDAFRQFFHTLSSKGVLFYNASERDLKSLVEEAEVEDIRMEPYEAPEYRVEDGKYYVSGEQNEVALRVQGTHNLENMGAAKSVCEELGVDQEAFFEYFKDFSGAGKRLQFLGEMNGKTLYRDFAHAPSKVKGVLEGLRDQFPKEKILAVFEFHTYSSLSKEFLPFFRGTFDAADEVWFFVDDQALSIKEKSPPDEGLLRTLTQRPVQCFYEAKSLKSALTRREPFAEIGLLMSSGDFGGLKEEELVQIQ